MFAEFDKRSKGLDEEPKTKSWTEVFSFSSGKTQEQIEEEEHCKLLSEANKFLTNLVGSNFDRELQLCQVIDPLMLSLTVSPSCMTTCAERLLSSEARLQLLSAYMLKKQLTQLKFLNQNFGFRYKSQFSVSAQISPEDQLERLLRFCSPQ